MPKGKVVFVEPRNPACNTFSSFMDIPLLGPVYLATIARQAGFDAVVLNENILKRGIRDQELIEADQLCLTCLTATVERGKELAVRYRRLRRQQGLSARAMIGGIHASMMPDDVAPYFHHVAVGEGESIILDLLAGDVRRKVVRGTPVSNLDSLPLPAFELVRGWRPDWIWPVMTSRGCPFDCDFCSVTEMFGRRYRAQSPERIMREIERYRRGYVFFVDDNLAVMTKRLHRLLDLMRQVRYPLKWTAQVRADVTRHPALVARMRQQGCTWVYVGFESINPSSLQERRKGQSVEEIRRSVKVLHDNRIRIHGMFMFGSDAETPEVFKQTASFVRGCHMDTAQFNILTPLPGTNLFERMAAEGRLLHRDWRFFDGLHVVFRPKRMAPAELQRGMISCSEDFYTYTAAFGEALATLADTTGAALHRLWGAKRPCRSPEGALVRLAARATMKRWVKQNIPYVGYLSDLLAGRPATAPTV